MLVMLSFMVSVIFLAAKGAGGGQFPRKMAHLHVWGFSSCMVSGVSRGFWGSHLSC